MIGHGISGDHLVLLGLNVPGCNPLHSEAQCVPLLEDPASDHIYLPFTPLSPGATVSIIRYMSTIAEAESTRSGLALPWGLLLIFDFCIFALTALKAFQIGLEHPKTLLRVILRDGTSALCYISVCKLILMANFEL